MPDATFTRPDLTTFTRLDGLGLEVTGQLLEPGRAVLACRVVEPDQWCRRCGCEGLARDTVTRPLAHEPFGWRPTTLLVTQHAETFAERYAGVPHEGDARERLEPPLRLLCDAPLDEAQVRVRDKLVAVCGEERAHLLGVRTPAVGAREREVGLRLPHVLGAQRRT